MLNIPSEKVLAGVHCEVDCCVYNNGSQRCTAPVIEIKKRMAILGEETMCGSFEEA